MISRKDMDFFRICEATNTHQSTGNTAACPRFGERSKSTEFWKHFLAVFDIMAVVALTPRSRALAVGKDDKHVQKKPSVADGKNDKHKPPMADGKKDKDVQKKASTCEDMLADE